MIIAMMIKVKIGMLAELLVSDNLMMIVDDDCDDDCDDNC